MTPAAIDELLEKLNDHAYGFRAEYGLPMEYAAELQSMRAIVAEWAAGQESVRVRILRGALADIANSDDMTLTIARAKAKRIYEETKP